MNRPDPDQLRKLFENFEKQHAEKSSRTIQPSLQMENVEEWLQKLDDPQTSPHDLDQLYQLAIVQLQRLLAIDIAPTDPKAATHNRNLNASINILLTFLSRQKKPPVDKLPELLKLIEDNEAELRARFGVTPTRLEGANP
jgi:hypothetical protein